MRWKFLFFFYIKRMGKSKLYIGASVLFFLLLITRFILFFSSPFDYEAYGQLPSELAMIVQMVSLFYMVFFYRILSNELLYGVQSFFVDGYQIMLEKISAMLAAHSLFQGIIVIVTYMMYSVTYFIVGIEPSGFYFSLFRFLLIYVFSPLIISMLFGLIMAMLFGTKKISFFGILLVWIATGGMTTELFIDFFSTVHANEWQSLLFIGMNTPMHVYKPYIGFDVHWGNELKLITWFLIIAAIILLVSLRWTHRKRERNIVIKVLLAMFFLSVFSSYGVVEVSTKAFSRADQITETNYYMNMDDTEADLNYEIESYTIKMEEKQVTVKVDFSRMDTMNPTFQLYHAYPIQQIKSGNKKVEFERSGDIVKVGLPTRTSSLTFYYEIVDTNFVPYTNGRTALLADIAWYPKKRASHMYVKNDFRERWIDLTERFLPEESYLFTLEVNKVLFTNLPRNGDVYSGKAQAVTLIKGQGNQLTYGNYHITYPADWPKMEDRIATVISQLETTLKEIQLFAPATIQSLPTAIVFSSFGPSSFMVNDHLIYNTGGYMEAIDSHGVTKDFQEKTLQLTVQRKGTYQMHNEWINMSNQYIRQKLDWAIDLPGRSVDSFALPQAEQETIEFIYNNFYQLNQDQQQQFLRDWYEKMDETWTWDQVLELVKGWS
ncbi:ABC transporter permease [Bacillus sp. V3-13]|uniref:ABC transporter permease n=1 Tax=Bacillus sp. V3-13 TaxID=2053728 RepID=UPI000C76AB93|nr:ABC transporter permease [Bacillus sp. V3-13]PLR76330.1 ABC transporter permease [Bacillus sp. V3-13]